MAARPDFLTPIHLSAPIVGTDASSYEETLDAYSFLNPNKTAMLVDEFRLTMPGFVSIPVDNELQLARLNIEMKMGSIPLTRNLVPFFSCFPRYLGFTTGAFANTGAYVNTGNRDGTFSWQLEKPMWVPRDVALSIRLQANGAFTDDGATFSVVGRATSQLSEAPDKIWVPWASGFRVLPATATNYVTNDQELSNPFEEELHVTRFLGYDSLRTAAATTGDTTIQMTRSANRALIRDATPFRLLFPSDRGLLELGAVLQPKDFIRAELQAPTGSDLSNVSVGFVGFREVATPGIK